MSNNTVELLAPAGNKEAFLGAIHAGADAVYLAGNKYGARAFADNFTTEELVFCIRYAHIWGRKVYLTVNTLMKEAELADLYEYIAPFYKAGLDACIVQDLGAFQLLKNSFPEMELHVSTQMTITGVNGAQFLKDLGATRIVPARELSLDEIKQMKTSTGLEIETFIHGAMCYSYSGQCLFSSILGGRSGNRGRCAQPCRLPYKVDTGKGNSKECYPLSLKDMCTIEHIEAFMDAGIDSFKIEGRMKKPEYAAGVTAIYRKYIDLKKTNPGKKLRFEKADLDNLSKLYIRSQRQDGYYFKQNGADMVTLDNPAYSGSDDELLTEIRRKYIDTKPKKELTIYASVKVGEKAFVMLTSEYLSVCTEGDLVEKAQNTPLSKESIEKQLSKLGDTCFESVSIDVDTDGESFYSLKALNELRRKAVFDLENMFIEEQGLCMGRSLEPMEQETEPIENTSSNCSDWTILLSTVEQVKAFGEYYVKSNLKFSRIYVESDLILNTPHYLESLRNEKNIYIALPYCMRDKDKEKIQKLLLYAQNASSDRRIRGFLVRNLEEYAYLKEQNYTGEIHGDSGIYIWNSAALRFWENRLTGMSAPLELNRKELQQLFRNKTYEKPVYGRIPMMITANCVAKTTEKCFHGKGMGTAVLTDRYNKQFPVSLYCSYCMNIIYNSLPLSLHKDIMDGKANYTKKLLFTIEKEQETKEVLQFFEQIWQGNVAIPPFGEYTTAHEKRGVE